MKPIFDAILRNDLQAFLGLVEEKESRLDGLSKEQNLNNTVLHAAAKLGRSEIVSKIIELRPYLVCSLNAKGNTPLHLAALLGDVDIKAWVVEDGSLSTLLHHTCDRGDLELTSILLGLDQGLEDALDSNGLSPLHLAVLRGSVSILWDFLDKAPLSFTTLTTSRESVFHLAARNKNIDAFIFMAENVNINSQILLQQTDENGNSVLHIAVYVDCGAQLIRYIIGKKIVDIRHKNNMGFEAFQLLPREAQDFDLLSRWLRFGTKTSAELVFEDNEEHKEHCIPLDKQSSGRIKPLDTRTSKSPQEDEVIRLLGLIGTNISKLAERERSKEREVEKDGESLEYKMHIEALQNARNTIAIVAVLIASVAYAGGINPPGGVYQEGQWRGKSTVGKTTAFKIFAICNNIALFTSLCIVILLVSIIPYKRKPLKRLLVATHRMMWVSVGFIATAYLAASWVIIPHHNGTRWLLSAIVVVAVGVLFVLFSYLGVETIGHRTRKINRVGDIPSFAKTSSDLAASEASGYFTY
ncbi:unnamed protein product [Cochlearia groenlandica]